MKKIKLWMPALAGMVILILFFASCAAPGSPEKRSNTGSKAVISSPAKGPSQNGAAKPADPMLQKQLFGIWGAPGSPSAVLEINSTKFYYVDRGAWYTYTLKGDSVAIKYDDFTGTYAVSFHGPDTLVLANPSDGKSVYYRLKN